MTEQRTEYATEPVQVAATGAWKLYRDGKWQEIENFGSLLVILGDLLEKQQPTMTETYRVERVR